MKIKGRTTIQLLDRDKKVTHEVVEENLITKAVERIALLQGRDFIKGLRSHSNNIFYYHTYNIAPIATELFGGILLFEGQLPEDEDLIFPPVTAKPVGHAGAPYSGTNPFRGTYNAAESGPIKSGLTTIGYRHVWDFVTDRANATIGCVCLTSRLGGNTGWKSRGVSSTTSSTDVFDADSQIDTYLLSGLNTSYKTFSAANLSRGPALVKSVHSDNAQATLLYFNDDTGVAYLLTASGTIAKSTFTSDLTLGLDTQPTFANVSSLTDIINTNSSYLARRTFAHFNSASREFTVVRPVSSTTIERKVYGETGSTVSTETVNLVGAMIENWTSSAVPPFYYKGKYYCLVSSSGSLKIGEFDSAGALLKVFDWPINTSGCVVTYVSALDKIEIRGRASGNVFVVYFDGADFSAFKSIDSSNTLVQPVESDPSVVPGYYASTSEYDGSGYVTSLFYKFQTNYLASINNLAAPVTKTGSDMMKITYDILYEE